MGFARAGHGSPSSTLLKNVGSVQYSIASPDLATRPPHTVLFKTPPSPGHFLTSSLSCYSVQFLPIYFFPCPAHHIPHICGDPPARPQGVLKRAVSSNHSHAFLVSPCQAVACPGGALAPGPRPNPTLFPTGLVKVSVLADWFLYLKLIPCTWHTHRPDDGGSKNLWNAGKLLPDYMALQPRRQPP
jgi:hypothetical protein